MLDIKNLRICFPGSETPAVGGIDLHMAPGEVLGLVGESGSGKTITALTIAGLVRRERMQIEGEINFCSRSLLTLPPREMRKIQGRDIGMIFQEPMTSLDPLMRVGPQIEEVLRIHTDLPAARRKALALEVIEKVGLPEPELIYRKYPHQLSGGQRQRAMIAAAIIISPKLLIADEPTTALDVTVQAQILQLLARINKTRGIGILFISHDLNVVRGLCSRVAVMQKGLIVESGPVEKIFSAPEHEYTKKLISAIPMRKKPG